MYIYIHTHIRECSPPCLFPLLTLTTYLLRNALRICRYIERDDEEWETYIKPALLKFCVDLDKNMKEVKEVVLQEEEEVEGDNHMKLQ